MAEPASVPNAIQYPTAADSVSRSPRFGAFEWMGASASLSFVCGSGKLLEGREKVQFVAKGKKLGKRTGKTISGIQFHIPTGSSEEEKRSAVFHDNIINLVKDSKDTNIFLFYFFPLTEQKRL